MKVKAHVYVIKDGQTVLLRPGDTVPEGVEVTNPDVIEADAKILPAPAPEETAEDEHEATPAPRKRQAAKAQAADS